MRGRASSDFEALVAETVARVVRVHEGPRIELVAGIGRIDFAVSDPGRRAEVLRKVRLVLAETIRMFDTRRRQGANPGVPLAECGAPQNHRGRRARRLAGSRA